MRLLGFLTLFLSLSVQAQTITGGTASSLLELLSRSGVQSDTSGQIQLDWLRCRPYAGVETSGYECDVQEKGQTFRGLPGDGTPLYTFMLNSLAVPKCPWFEQAGTLFINNLTCHTQTLSCDFSPETWQDTPGTVHI